MDLLESKNYNIALKVFDNICNEWGLSELEKLSLLDPKTSNNSSLITMSRVFGIYIEHCICCLRIMNKQMLGYVKITLF